METPSLNPDPYPIEIDDLGDAPPFPNDPRRITVWGYRITIKDDSRDVWFFNPRLLGQEGSTELEFDKIVDDQENLVEVEDLETWGWDELEDVVIQDLLDTWE